jgi:hypothetical protein
MTQSCLFTLQFDSFHLAQWRITFSFKIERKRHGEEYELLQEDSLSKGSTVSTGKEPPAFITTLGTNQ